MVKQEWNELFSLLERKFPHAKLELEASDPFTLLIATILSARCTDKAVNKVLPILFADGRTPKVILSLGEEEVRKRINSINLYNNKTRFIIGVCQKIVELGCVPNTLEGLIKLPGVGRKTANIVLAAAFDQITFPVDTHVFRVSNRIGLAPGKTPGEVESKLIKNVPRDWAKKSHLLLILHGRYICKSQKPKCSECPVSHLCDYFSKNSNSS